MIKKQLGSFLPEMIQVPTWEFSECLERLKSGFNRTDLVDDLDPEAEGTVGTVLHLVEAQPVQPLLEEVVHVLPAALPVGHDVKARLRLVRDRPTRTVRS